VSLNPNKSLALVVSREGRMLDLTIKAKLDPDTGAGRIGVFAWTEPVIHELEKGSAADLAGLLAGDRILSVNGHPVSHTVDILYAMKDRPEKVKIEYSRAGTVGTADCVVSYGENGDSKLGISFPMIEYRTPRLDPFSALAKGVSETLKTTVISFKSFALLFQGMNIMKAVSGPIRIGYMVSDATEAGLAQGLSNGISVLLNFLSLISVALFVMNCLPIPILDGGQIVFSLVEGLRGKAFQPKVMYYFNIVGNFIILAILSLAVFSDAMFFTSWR
jgi:regulator of sigma E protease